MVNLDHISDKDLLKLPLRVLGKSFTHNLFISAPGLLFQREVRRLQRRGLLFRPGLWWSTEWFCPDGVSGVGLPFYLAHPRLIYMQKKYVGEAEGDTETECVKLIRHELGHAADNAYGLRKHPERWVFGDHSLPYPTSYSPRPYSRAYVKHLPNHYAQSHPDEDFAETFAVWMSPQRVWQKQYRCRPKALEKLKTINRMLLAVKNQKPLLVNTKKVDAIDRMNITLSQYYRQARRSVEFKERVRIQQHLLQNYGTAKGASLEKWLFSNRRVLVRDVAAGTGAYQ